MKKKVYLSLGSNLGDRHKTLQQAVQKINDTIGEVTKISAIYETEPLGFNSPFLFLNACVEIETELNPLQLLTGINEIENTLGRTRNPEGGYISRTLDIDILFYDHIIIDNEEVTIPHPRLSERLFVLVPLCDLDKNMVDPVSGRSISDLVKNCQDTSHLTQFDLPLII